MKKTILSIFLMACAYVAHAVSEDDFLLYWQVDNPIIDIYGNGLGGEKTGTTTFSQLLVDTQTDHDSWFVQVAVFDTSTGKAIDYVDLHYGDPPEWTSGINMIGIDEAIKAGPTYANIGKYMMQDSSGTWTSGIYAFALELGYFNSSDEFDRIVESEHWSYTDFITNCDPEHSYIKSTQLQLPDTMPWTGGAFTLTPEPNAGMLMLVGMMILSLCRKDFVIMRQC